MQIVVKPESISWEAVRQCLMESHADNLERGIHMAHPQWPVDRLRDAVGDNGVMLVALDGDRLVGTAAFSEKTTDRWYVHGRYAYLCFAGILPEYRGKGLYQRLLKDREEMVRARHIDTLIFDTHAQNKPVQVQARRNGYCRVCYFRAVTGDHDSVVLVKWINGKSPSRIYCALRFAASYLKVKTRRIFSRYA